MFDNALDECKVIGFKLYDYLTISDLVDLISSRSLRVPPRMHTTWDRISNSVRIVSVR